MASSLTNYSIHLLPLVTAEPALCGGPRRVYVPPPGAQQGATGADTRGACHDPTAQLLPVAQGRCLQVRISTQASDTRGRFSWVSLHFRRSPCYFALHTTLFTVLCRRFMAPGDEALLAAVRDFNQFDLYSKGEPDQWLY